MSEKLCWDCPKRSGVSRYHGMFRSWFARLHSDGEEQIARQRGQCVGRIPVQVLSQYGITNEVGPEVVTITRDGSDLYVPGCPNARTYIAEVPVDVMKGFKDNGEKIYTHPIHKVTTVSREEYDRRMERLRSHTNLESETST